MYIMKTCSGKTETKKEEEKKKKNVV